MFNVCERLVPAFRVNTKVYLSKTPGNGFYALLLHGWILERARWCESTILIGYPSGARLAYHARSEFPALFPLSPPPPPTEFCFWLYIKPFFDQACSDQDAFRCILTSTNRNAWKNLANIQPSWHHTGSITHLYIEQLFLECALDMSYL